MNIQIGPVYKKKRSAFMHENEGKTAKEFPKEGQ